MTAASSPKKLWGSIQKQVSTRAVTSVIPVHPNASQGASSIGEDSEGTSMRHSAHRSAKPTTPRLAKAEGKRMKQRLNLVRRLLILAAAVFYVVVAIRGFNASVAVLSGDTNLNPADFDYETLLAGAALGESSLLKSPLVKTLLNGDTTPRTGTLHLFTDGDGILAAGGECPVPAGTDPIYTDAYVRSLYTALARDAAYNLTFLDASAFELVVPVIDCTSSARVMEDASAARLFFLLRNPQDAADLLFLVVTMSAQGYSVVTRNEIGSACVMVLSAIRSVDAEVEHHFALSIGYPFQQLDIEVYQYVETTRANYWKLRSIPRNALTHVSKTLITACRDGFFVGSETEQSNVKNIVWARNTDAKDTVKYMHWQSALAVRDSWAWVHFVHLLLAGDVLFQVFVLLLLTYHNVRARKYWLGDAFVSISSTLVWRGFLVVLSMVLNKFWALKEFCIADAKLVAGVPSNTVNREILHADLMVIYLSLVGLLGKVLKARIDPAITMLLFEFGYHLRFDILSWLPPLQDIVIATGIADFSAGAVVTEEDTSLISPMMLWGPHQLIPITPGFMFAALFPIFSTLLVIIAMSLSTKLVRLARDRRQRATRPSDEVVCCNPDGSDATGSTDSTSRAAAKQRQRLTTNFELATGARLAHHCGLMSDYDVYSHIKGLCFASADGIYGSGFVIVNSKFLVQTDDLLTILLMKIARMRFRNVYACDVDEYNVRDMARLVYPDTMTFADLLRLNISVLT